MNARTSQQGQWRRPALWAAVLTVAAIPLNAQVSAATVVVAEGQVSLLRDGQEWALFGGDAVGVGQTIVTGDIGFAQLEVADGSSFLVYPSSQVVFRKNPGSLRDLIDVFLGRIKVHIQRLGGQPNPHRIFTPTAVISVRGTTFEVAVDETEITVVSVEEGLVTVAHRLLPSGRETPVGAGESLTIHPLIPLAESGVDRLEAVRVADNVARIAASIWRRIGGSGSGGAGSGGGTSPAPTPLPGDEEAPAPPPPPPPGQ